MSNLADKREQSYRKKYNYSINETNNKNEDRQMFYISNSDLNQNNFNSGQASPGEYCETDLHPNNQRVINSFPKQNQNINNNKNSNHNNFKNYSANKINFRQSTSNENSAMENSLNTSNNLFPIRLKENEETDKVFKISNLSQINNVSGNYNKNKSKEKKKFEECNNQKRKSVDKSNLLFYSDSQDFVNDNKINSSNINSNHNNNNNNLLMNTIEKDRMIFEYSKLMKDTKIENEEIKKAFEAREEIVTRLLEDNKTLNSNLKNMQSKLNSKEEEIEKLKLFFEEKLYLMEKEKCNLELRSTEMIKKLEEQNSVTLILKSNLKKFETELHNCKKILQEKEEINLKTGKKLDELRKENINIPSLKKSLLDLERKNQDLVEELKSEKAISMKCLRKERMNQSADLQDNSNFNTEYAVQAAKSEKITAFSDNQKIKFANENLMKELDSKSAEAENLNEKYKQIFAENENFVKFITNEILNFNSFFECFPRFDLKIDSEIKLKQNLNRVYDKSDFKMFSLQYDIIKKNFDSIMLNFEAKYNENLEAYAKLEKTNFQNEAKIKNLQKEKDAAHLDLSLCSQKIKDLSESSNKLLKENQNLFEMLSNLQSSCLKLNAENEELKRSNEEWKILKNNLIYNVVEKINYLHTKFDIYYSFSQTFEKLNANKIGKANENFDYEINVSGKNNNNSGNNKEFKVYNSFKDPEEQMSFIHNESQNEEANLNFTKSEKENDKSALNSRLIEEPSICYVEKLCEFIDWFILEYTRTHLLNKELSENNKFFREEIKKMNDERECLDKRIDTLMIGKEEELKEKDKLKAVEIDQLKESFEDQIYKLTILNNKNNLLINKMENEIAQLKETNRKYENNLRLLTGSHKELEKSINNNFQVLNEEIEHKESKYNFLLRENQIKETHLKSLESLLKRKKEENDSNLLFNCGSESPRSLKYQSNLEEENLKSTADFVYNPNKEEELNALIANCTDKQGGLITEANHNNQLFNDSKNEFQSNSAQSFYENKNIKVPGRIYSYRK